MTTGHTDETTYSKYTLTNNLTGDTDCIPQVAPGALRAYLLERRRALLAEVAGIERLLGFEKKTVDKR